jgi:TPP-dependent pyruvate/acetoin dehydrogenase alpha subunit
VAQDVVVSPEAARDVGGGDVASPEVKRDMSSRLPDADAAGVAQSEYLTRLDQIGLAKAMLMMRGMEARALSLYKQGRVPGSFYDGYGQEAVSAGAVWALSAQDRLCILHRDLAAHLIRGVDPARILAQYMGRASGPSRGRDGNVHFAEARLGCVSMVSMLPDMLCVAVGLAMAAKLTDEPRVALTWCGDGASSRGDFHEALNWAGVQKLGVIFILENNQYAYSTPTARQFPVDPVQRAAAYGMPGVTVDGNDAEAMFEAVRVARLRGLAGEGPTLIEAVTMRMHGHAAHDDSRYVPDALFAHWRERDPIALQSERLRALGVDVAALEAEVKAEIDAATEVALASPMPDPADVLEGVFATGEPVGLGDEGRAPWSGFAPDRLPRNGRDGAQNGGIVAEGQATDA